MDWSAVLPDEVFFAGNEHLDPDSVAAYDRKAAFDPTADVSLLGFWSRCSSAQGL